jgi:hypothetical protein
LLFQNYTFESKTYAIGCIGLHLFAVYVFSAIICSRRSTGEVLGEQGRSVAFYRIVLDFPELFGAFL